MLIINLRARRKAYLLTQKEIANILNITYQQYQKYEYNLIIPNLKRFFEITKILNIPKNLILESLMIDYKILNINEAKRIAEQYSN